MSAFTHGVKVVFAVGLFASALVACDDGTTGTGGSSSSTTGTKGTTTTTSKSSSGAQMTTGTGGGGVCGSLLWDDRPDCEACMEGSCCGELTDCDPANAQSDCGKLVVCLNACMAGDDACQQACVDADANGTAMGAGLTALQAAFSCYDTNCSTDPACVYEICDSMLTLPDEACATCLGTSCCSDIKACAADQGCLGCLGMPPDAGMTCGAAASTSDMLYTAEETCKNGMCKTSCTFSICGSDLGYNLAACNACLTDTCCGSYTPCFNDAACKACLGAPDGAGCATNQLFTAFTTCRDTDGAAGCGDPGECNFQ